MRINGIGQSGLLGGVAFGLALCGCNSFDQPSTTAPGEGKLVIPTDTRGVTTSSSPARPISGGTLSVTSGPTPFAIATDPERDIISIVDVVPAVPELRATITLEPGDEPGRSAEDTLTHQVHVVLRGGGAVVTIDPGAGSVVSRRSVCKAPRGIAFDPATSLVHVACAEGKLVSLPSQGGEAVRTLNLETDLRDVIVQGSELWVTRFKSAEVLRIDATGTVGGNRIRIPAGFGNLTQPAPQADEFSGGQVSKSVNLRPGVAYRATANLAGGAVIVHQDEVADEIDVPAPSTSGSAYGGTGSFDCGGIVKNVVSNVQPNGQVTSTQFVGSPLPVDVAVSPDSLWVAVAHAGPADLQAPRPFVIFPSDGPSAGSSGGVAFAPTTTISVLPMQGLTTTTGGGCNFPSGVSVQEPVVAVAFTPSGKLIAQTREPATLLAFDDVQNGAAPARVTLSFDSRLDTGHELFNRDSGGGIACASCHPEGGEDGHTWRFADVGDRRTQALHVGLEGTAPFHWNGDLPNVGKLMGEVFVNRMGGVKQSEARIDTLTDWLFSIPRPPAIRDAGEEAVVRGQGLFNSASVGCATCHSGAKLTSNESVAIDSVNNAKLQVPSLVAIGYRAPFMHTGCAATLAARFDPACGGNAHGNTSSLSDEQKADLVAYLESL